MLKPMWGWAYHELGAYPKIYGEGLLQVIPRFVSIACLAPKLAMVFHAAKRLHNRKDPKEQMGIFEVAVA